MAFMGIIPEAQSFGTQLARGLGGGLGAGASQAVNFAQQMALEKAKSKSLAHETKQLEKVKMIENGLGTIDKMKELISSAGPSNAIQSFLGIGDARKNRAQLESLGLSLIPLRAAGVPVRNQREFDKYSSVITNPNSRQEDLEGALDGLQDILMRSLDSRDESEESEQKSSSNGEKVKFSPENLEHQKKARQLDKKFNKDRTKVREALSKEFEF